MKNPTMIQVSVIESIFYLDFLDAPLKQPFSFCWTSGKGWWMGDTSMFTLVSWSGLRATVDGMTLYRSGSPSSLGRGRTEGGRRSRWQDEAAAR